MTLYFRLTSITILKYLNLKKNLSIFQPLSPSKRKQNTDVPHISPTKIPQKLRHASDTVTPNTARPRRRPFPPLLLKNHQSRGREKRAPSLRKWHVRKVCQSVVDVRENVGKFGKKKSKEEKGRWSLRAVEAPSKEYRYRIGTRGDRLTLLARGRCAPEVRQPLLTGLRLFS